MSSWTTGRLAEAVGATCTGPSDRRIDGVASLSRAGPRELAFAIGRHRLALATSAAGAVIVDAVFDGAPGVVWLVHPEPRLAFARAAALLHPPSWPDPGCHPRAQVDPSATVEGATIDAFAVVEAGAVVGPGSWVQPQAYIGRGVVMGTRCRVFPTAVVLDGTVMGDRVTVGPGAVVGAPGFGVVPTAEGPVAVPQLGRVHIGDDVDLGANTCVDRAALDETTVGAGTRADNFVQIAHGVTVGRDVLLAAFAGLAGSANIGDRVVLGGRAAVTEGVRVGDGAVLSALASATRDVAPSERQGGSPARPHRTWLRELATLRRLTKLLPHLEAAVGGSRGAPMDRSEIEALLPHREPFLLVDRILEVEPGVSATCEKSVRDDEFWVPGHFPGEPIFPGVLMTEAIAQVAGIAHLTSKPPGERGKVYLVGVDKMRFRRMVRPGDVLHLTAKVVGQKRGLWFFEGTATTAEGERVASGEFIAKVD